MIRNRAGHRRPSISPGSPMIENLTPTTQRRPLSRRNRSRSRSIRPSTTTTVTSWEETRRRLWSYATPFLLYLFYALAVVFALGSTAALSLKGPENVNRKPYYQRVPDICNVSTHNCTSSILCDDPTGIATVANWTNTAKELMAARRSLIELSYGVTLLVADTEVWQDVIAEGPEIYQLALSYSEAQVAAEDQIDEMIYSHTSFMDSITYDVKVLSDNVNRMLQNYGSISHSFLELWYSSIQWIPLYTPTGRMNHDFLQFVNRQSAELVPLINKTQSLLDTLRITKNARIALTTKTRAAWKAWERDCLEVTYGITRLQGARQTVKNKPKCRQYNYMVMERIMKQDLGDFLDVANAQVSTHMTSYKYLHGKYRTIQSYLTKGILRLETTELGTYRAAFGLVNGSVSNALTAIEVALRDGRYDPRFS